MLYCGTAQRVLNGIRRIVNFTVITVMNNYTLHLESSVTHLCGVKYTLETPYAKRAEGNNREVLLRPIPSNS